MSALEWPQQLHFFRHAESSYNSIKEEQQHSSLYTLFRQAYEEQPHGRETVSLAKALVEHFESLAGDHNSPITDDGYDQAILSGKWLSQTIDMPQVIFVSPYVRTKQTLAALINGWPELTKVRIIEDERIREKEFGLRILYGDNRLMFALHPEQKQLYEAQGRYWYRPPQGENVPDVRARLRHWTDMISRDYAGKKVLAVTHHMAILAFRANMERMSAEQFLYLDDTAMPRNCSLSSYKGQLHATTGHQRLALTEYDVVGVR